MKVHRKFFTWPIWLEAVFSAQPARHPSISTEISEVILRVGTF